MIIDGTNNNVNTIWISDLFFYIIIAGECFKQS